MLLEPLRHAIGAVACTVAGHRFVVWVRASAPAPRHPHLGAWARCERCGHERDWLGPAVALDDRVLDLIHGVVRPLHEVQAIARGERSPARREGEPAAPFVPPAGAARAGHQSTRSMRRRSGEGRSSTRHSTHQRAPRERDPG